MKYLTCALCLLILTACAPDSVHQEMVLGIVLPLTGDAASFGEGGRAGVELALSEINANGGINGIPLSVVYEDDKCGVAGANAVSKLVHVDAVDAIVGFVCSPAAAAGLPITLDTQTPVILTGASAPELTSIGANIFRIYPSDSFAGTYLATFASESLGASSAAIIYAQSQYGQGIRQEFSSAFSEQGGSILFEAAVDVDERDYRPILLKLSQQEVDVIVLPLHPAGGRAFVEQAREQGLTVSIIGGDYFDTPEFTDGAVDGTRYITADVQMTPEFRERVRALTGTEPNIITPMTYDAVHMFANALSLVGSDPSALAREIGQSQYPGVSSPTISFDAHGNLQSAQYVVHCVRCEE